MSLTISRTRWIQAASTQGTTPAAGRPTAMATFPATPAGLRSGEYAAITTSAAIPTRSAVPLTRAAMATPMKIPAAATRCAVSRRSRPAATGRSPPGRFTRSAATSRRSFKALPAAPNPTAATAANPSRRGTAIAPRATHPPASTPAAATRRLPALTSRSRSVTEHALIHLLVLRDDLIGGERARALRGGPTHPRVHGGIAQQGHGALDHLIHRTDGGQVARFPLGDNLREPADSAGHDGHRARHRLEGGEAERLALRRQQKQIGATQDLSDVLHLAEEAHV